MSFQTEELLDRLRASIGDRLNIHEQRMFGGVVFMLNGNMLCGIAKGGQLMARVGKELEAKARQLPGATDMDFTGKKMGRMLFVDGDGAEDDESLESWITICERFVATLPPKAPKKPKKPKVP